MRCPRIAGYINWSKSVEMVQNEKEAGIMPLVCAQHDMI